MNRRYFNPHVSRIVEMKPEHVLLGAPGSARGGPAALAMEEAGYRDVSVGLDFISAGGLEFRMGPRLRGWVQALEEHAAANGPPILSPEDIPGRPLPLLVDAAAGRVDLYLEELCMSPSGE